MAVELITRRWCDLHLEKHEEQVEGRSFEFGGREVDLCDACALPFAQAAALVEEYGRRPPKATGASKVGGLRPGAGRTPVVPEGVEGVPCPECGREYKSERRMKDHRSRMHATPGPPFVCEPCGKEFKNAQGLGAHNGRTHAT